MTSQKVEKTDERVALEAVAKELGVKSVHMFKKEGSLEAAIAKKQAEIVASEPKLEIEEVTKELEQETPLQAQEVVAPKPSPKRKTAPRMNIANIGNDDRTAMITRLEREDPECKYVFQNSNVTGRELAAKGLEKTEFSIKNDVVCRTMKDSFVEFQHKKNEAQYEAMQRIDGGTGIVGNHEARVKTPKMADV